MNHRDISISNIFLIWPYQAGVLQVSGVCYGRSGKLAQLVVYRRKSVGDSWGQMVLYGAIITTGSFYKLYPVWLILPLTYIVYSITLNNAHSFAVSCCVVFVDQCEVDAWHQFSHVRKRSSLLLEPRYFVPYFVPSEYRNKSSQWLPNTPFASISECLVS